MSNKIKIPEVKVKLIHYTKLEDALNSVSHFIGIPLGIIALFLCVRKSLELNSKAAVTASIVYGLSIILLYGASAFYHAAKPGKLKLFLRVIDHSNIFLLIAGTATPYALVAFLPSHPVLGWVSVAFVWLCALVGISLTVINMEKFKVIQMVMYISIGWFALFLIKPMLAIFSGLLRPGLTLLVVGGVVYTLGAIVYG
ncbi:MAG TPA: hemolysin III family protein, partial [Clostridiales bacterium]|nr:hemolysin III family protein [Clostridiales bacterium]